MTSCRVQISPSLNYNLSNTQCRVLKGTLGVISNRILDTNKPTQISVLICNLLDTNKPTLNILNQIPASNNRIWAILKVIRPKITLTPNRNP